MTEKTDKPPITEKPVEIALEGASSAKLVAAVADQPMEILKPTRKETATVEGGGTKAE